MEEEKSDEVGCGVVRKRCKDLHRVCQLWNEASFHGQHGYESLAPW